MAESVEQFKVRMSALCDAIEADKALWNDPARTALLLYVKRLKTLLDEVV